jgi:hypothetical protein
LIPSHPRLLDDVNDSDNNENEEDDEDDDLSPSWWKVRKPTILGDF